MEKQPDNFFQSRNFRLYTGLAFTSLLLVVITNITPAHRLYMTLICLAWCWLGAESDAISKTFAKTPKFIQSFEVPYLTLCLPYMVFTLFNMFLFEFSVAAFQTFSDIFKKKTSLSNSAVQHVNCRKYGHYSSYRSPFACARCGHYSFFSFASYMLVVGLPVMLCGLAVFCGEVAAIFLGVTQTISCLAAISHLA